MSKKRKFPAPAVRQIAPKGTITLGIPCADPEPHTMRTVMELVMWDRDYGRRHLHPSQPWTFVIGATMVTNARNTIVRRFLDQPEGDQADWLLFLDDDQLYPQSLLEQLIEAADPVERRIVGLPVWRFASTGDGPIRVTHNVMDLHESGAFVEWSEPFPENTVMEVAAVGTGCLLIHRSALEEMQTKSEEMGNGTHWCWFRQQVYQPADMCEGEDLFFCRLAWNCGIPVWLNTSVTLEHVKPIRLAGPVPDGVLAT
jgi:hypothetical protein